MTNISEASFYKIFLKSDPTQFYIGSTYKLSSRKSHHKKNATNKRSKLYWTKLYQYIRTNGGWDNFQFELLYKASFETKESRLIEEQTILNILNPPLNSNKACKCINDYVFDVESVIAKLNSKSIVNDVSRASE
jgi:predicted GIY-YIG superfamily endonuclease